MKNIINFIGQTKEELKKVTWPNKKEIMRLTTIVIVSSFIVGVYLSAMDYIFTKLLGIIIG